MHRSVTLYRKNQQWKALYLDGVSLQYGQNQKLTAARDKYKSKDHRVDQGVQLQKWAQVKIPKERMPDGVTVEVGDLLLPDTGPEQLSSASQPWKEGWTYFVVQQVEDRLNEPVLPHLSLKCS